MNGFKRALCLLLAAALPLAFDVPAAAVGAGADIVILLDASAATSLAGGDAPWLCCPCLNEAHFYLRPLAVDAAEAEAGVTFPKSAPAEAGAAGLLVYDAAIASEVALDPARRYRFFHSFLAEEGAHGWQPWRYHFMLDESGAPMRIEAGAEAGCIDRFAAGKALALALAEGALAAGDHRVAFCAFGEAGSSRWSCALTRDGARIAACIDAAPVLHGGDHAAALAKALAWLNHRSLDERNNRPAIVIVITGGEAFPKANALRALRLARMLDGVRGQANAPVFGTSLLPEERVCAGARVLSIGLMDGGSALASALASGEEDRFAFTQKETTAAFAAAVLLRVEALLSAR